MNRKFLASTSPATLQNGPSLFAIVILVGFLFGCVTTNTTPEEVAEIRALEVDSAVRLSLEGKILYDADEKKLSGYEYCKLGWQLADQGEFRRSIRTATKAIFLGKLNNNQDLLAFAKRDLAYAYSLAGNLDLAATYADEAISHTQKSNRRHRNPRILGPAYKILGDVKLRKGQTEAAIDDYEQALSASVSSYEPFVRASLANAYLAEGHPAKARELFVEIAEVSELQRLVRRGLGNVALAEGRYSEALGMFQEAAADESGFDGAYHRLWALEGIARTQRKMGDREGAITSYLGAISAAEQVRARFRSEEFKTGFFGDIQQIFDDAVALLAESGRVEQALEVSEKSRARALLDLVRERVQFSVGTDAIADPHGQPVSASKLRAELPEDLSIIEYHVLADRTLAWTIRKSKISLAVIDLGKAELALHVHRYRSSISDLSPQAPALAEGLYDWLIRPLALSDADDVVIIPHSSLHYLPFQALRGTNGYMIENRAVSYAPSASALVRLLEKAPRSWRQIIAFGNPDLKSPKLNLPGAQREVEQIKELYPQTELYVRQDATKERLIARGPQSDILHIAAHADVDEIDPLYSIIRLAGTEEVPGDIEAHEIYRMNLSNTSLVLLSACNTGLGRVSKGDEIWGFTRTFLGAGAQTLLVSLWLVADESTELLMTKFYNELQSVNAQQALRRAQIQLLHDDKFSHPFFWAPFIVIGDVEMRVPMI